MVQHTFDGFFTPAPTDVSAHRRWPWAVAGVALIAIAGVGIAVEPTGQVDRPVVSSAR